MAITINGTGSITGLTAGGLPDGSITTDDLAANAVTAAKLAAGAGGKILQVVSTNKQDTFSTASTSYTDITGLSASITPSSTSNKVLVFISVQFSLSGSGGALQVTRNGTAIGGGTAAGSRPSSLGQTSGEVNNNFANTTYCIAKNILDSPSSTSSLTYQVQIYTNSGTRYINRTNNDNDSTDGARSSSQIVLIEVAA